MKQSRAPWLVSGIPTVPTSGRVVTPPSRVACRDDELHNPLGRILQRRELAQPLTHSELAVTQDEHESAKQRHASDDGQTLHADVGPDDLAQGTSLRRRH